MPATPTYPGVYIQEDVPSAHDIDGVTTSDTAFVDVFERGPVNRPTMVTTWGDFVGKFGNITPYSKASYGIYQFFLNGGAAAWVVRVASDTAETATISTPHVDLQAVGPGIWGNNLEAMTQRAAKPGAPVGTFDLVVREIIPTSPTEPNARVGVIEIYRELSADSDDPSFVGTVLGHNSNLVELLKGTTPTPAKPGEPIPANSSITNPTIASNPSSRFAKAKRVNSDDWTLAPNDLGTEAEDGPLVVPATGFYTLAEIAPYVFNILCLPAMSAFTATQWQEVFSKAFAFCEAQRAFFIVDPPTALFDDAIESDQVNAIQKWFLGPATPSAKTNYAAIYFPRLSIDDPTGKPNPIQTEVSGTMAGIYARTDASSGVWKAPAGQAATLTGVVAPIVPLGDTSTGTLNELGVNCLRTLPLFGTVSWGARTLEGADLLDSEWKYIPVRRTALFIEQSLQQGIRWAVFEPNDEALWASLRLSIGHFMDALFKQGAFAGRSAKDAYFVQCDATTTTPADQRNGVVNVVVGFAPLYPAEFIVITITQIQER